MYNNGYGQTPYFQSRYGFVAQQPIYEQPMQANLTNQAIQNRALLNGKSVDSIEVVKAMDIPLDGTISYFPLADGSAIVTKQLQIDGTSKTIVYKPVDEEKANLKFVTQEDLDERIKKIDLSEIEDLKDEINDLKNELRNLQKKLKAKVD